MIDKTEAIALRISAFSNTSHVVTWFTPESGRIATVVKGACRPRSQFLGQYDLFQTCELLYYPRPRGGLPVAKECCKINGRNFLRSEWRATAAASYLCDMFLRLPSEGHHEPHLYGLLSHALDSLANRRVQETLLRFELGLLSVLGLTPVLQECSSCGRPIAPVASIRFSPSRGGVVCSRCPSSVGAGDTQLTAGSLAVLRAWAPSPPTATVPVRCSRQQLLELHQLLGTFINYHLHDIPASRAIAHEIITGTNSRPTSTGGHR